MQAKKKRFTRFSALTIIMLFIFAAVLSKLVYLQILKSEDYKQKANNSSITEIPAAAPRGKILDNKGTVLATSNQSYMLVYNDSPDSSKVFFDTMNKAFKILSDNGETIKDDFELKINPYRFEFRSSDPSVQRTLELRFKKDRGLDGPIISKLFKNKKGALTAAQQSQVDDELIKITPEQTFKLLVEKYKIDDAIKPKYNIDKQRTFMIIKDAVFLQSYSGYKPVTISSSIKQETAYVIMQKLNNLPGIDVSTQPIRTYPYGEVGSGFLGYISKISSNQELYQEKGYDSSTDYIGTQGIESAFEDRLKGSKGGTVVKLNKQGRVTEVLGSREPYPGQTVQLSIDMNVQNAAEKELDAVMQTLRSSPSMGGDTNSANATRGAAVAINVKTGAIIALASRPGFDPNVFSQTGRLTTDIYQKYFNPNLAVFGRQYIIAHGITQNYPGKSVDDVLNILFPVDTSIKGNTTIRKDMYDLYPKSLYNYATSSLFPPGSTFKPMTAIAGLEEGVITPSTTIHDNLVFTKNHFNGHELNSGSYGDVNVVKALEVSNNYFFFDVGDRLLSKGFDTLAKHAWQFGLGVDPKGTEHPSTGIEIPENFGQTSNLETIRNLFSAISYTEVSDNLNKTYGINLSSLNSDSKEIAAQKIKIKDSIKQQMKYKNVENFTAQLQSSLQQLLSTDPTLASKKYADKDLKIMTQKINIAINITYSQASMPGNAYNAAIGQGISQYTPLQMANYIATIVNGGNRNKLHLVDKILDSKGKVVEQVQTQVLDKVDISKSTLQAVKEGMGKVDEGTEGTAASVFTGFSSHIKTGGKTGSATFSDTQTSIGRTSYAVYVGFAPFDDPEIAVCVVVFDGGHGGFVAPVARAMYEAYFKDILAKQNYTPLYNFPLTNAN